MLPKEGFLSTKDLNSRGRILSQVGETARVRDEPSSDVITDQAGEIGRHLVDLRVQVLLQTLAVVEHLDDARSEHLDVDEIDGRDVHAHRRLGRVYDRLRLRRVHDHFFELLQQIVRHFFAVLNDLHAFRVHVVVRDDFDELREMVAVPFSEKKTLIFNCFQGVFKLYLGYYSPNSHRKRVDILIELIEQINSLNDHIINSIDVELDLGSGVSVSETELSLRLALVGQSLDEIGEMGTNAAQNLGHHTGVGANDSGGLVDARGDL